MLLDKTGTLTVGRPALQALRPVPGVEPEELLAVAAAAERHSEHPLAQAISAAARDRQVALPPVEGFQSTTGFGVTAQVGGRRVLVGRPGFLTKDGIDLTAVSTAITELEDQGHTVIAVSRDQRALGVIALADTLRPEAADTVARLRKAALIPVLVTGDNPRAAPRHVATALGIEQVHAEMLPEGKAELVGTLQASATPAPASANASTPKPAKPAPRPAAPAPSNAGPWLPADHPASTARTALSSTAETTWPSKRLFRPAGGSSNGTVPDVQGRGTCGGRR